MLRLTETTRAFAVSAFALAVTYAGNAAGPELILPGGGAYVVQINDDCTLTVDADVDVEYESFSVTGSGKLTLAGLREAESAQSAAQKVDDSHHDMLSSGFFHV